MKKILSLLFVLALLVGVSATHVHNDDCGYNPETNTGCIYESVDPLEDRPPYA